MYVLHLAQADSHGSEYLKVTKFSIFVFFLLNLVHAKPVKMHGLLITSIDELIAKFSMY